MLATELEGTGWLAIIDFVSELAKHIACDGTRGCMPG